MTVWRVRAVFYADKDLETLLNEGWEPFAVTRTAYGEGKIWLRKLVELDD